MASFGVLVSDPACLRPLLGLEDRAARALHCEFLKNWYPCKASKDAKRSQCANVTLAGAHDMRKVVLAPWRKADPEIYAARTGSGFVV